MKTDAELKKDVEAELNFEPAVDARHIGVIVKNSVVTLAGHVGSYTERWRAEEAAKRVYGVAAIANELDVKLPGTSERTDEELAAACAAALKGTYSLPADKVKAVVRSGFVELVGEVEWHYQKTAAELAIRDITGIRGVTNNITVKPRVSPTDVKQKIEDALKRSAELDARRISVETRDGTVTLRGNVRAWVEKEEAEQAAWAAPGVTAVQNEIRIAV
jgi:osmotically-inducible protein OsmY